MVLLLLDHVCVCVCECVCVFVSSYRGSFPLVIHTVSLHLSHSHCSEGEEGRGGERREVCGSGEKESKKRPRDEIRAAECGHGVFGILSWGVLSGAFEARYARECDRVMEGEGGGGNIKDLSVY